MKNIIVMIVASLLVGCATYGKTDAELNARGDLVSQLFGVEPKVAQPAVRLPVNHPAPTPVVGGCLPGTPTLRCGKLHNGLGNGLAIVVARVDNNPIVITPYGGTLPLPRLLDSEETTFVWPACTHRDPDSGACRYVFVGDAYETTDLRDQGVDIDPSLLIVPVIKPEHQHCFVKKVLVSTAMMRNGFTPSIQPEDEVPCPQGVVPKGTVAAK